MFRGSVKSTFYPLHSTVYPPLRHRVPSHFKLESTTSVFMCKTFPCATETRTVAVGLTFLLNLFHFLSISQLFQLLYWTLILFYFSFQFFGFPGGVHWPHILFANILKTAANNFIEAIPLCVNTISKIFTSYTTINIKIYTIKCYKF